MAANADRHSGIEAVGDVPWGTHLCEFYQAKEDLEETLVPYFADGLRNNERCMWVTSEPLTVPEADKALRKQVPDLDRYVERGQIMIVPHEEWYLKDGYFDLDRTLQGWVDLEEAALSDGYDGLRLTGNTCWLEKEMWGDFSAYEAAVDAAIGTHKMLAV